MMRQLDTHGVTNCGRVRDTNTDHFLVAPLECGLSMPLNGASRMRHTTTSVDRGVLMAVADGVAEDGERASAVAMRALADSVAEFAPGVVAGRSYWTEAEFVGRMRAAIRHCRDELCREAEFTGHDSLATTLTVASVFGPHLYLFHVGDSRCYRIHAGGIEQLSADHTVGQQFTSAGLVEESSLTQRYLQTLLWNSIQTGSEDLQIETRRVDLEPGDSVLLCTNGLFHMLGDAEIQASVEGARSAQSACQRLVACANDAGGEDNVTVVLSRSEAARTTDPPTRVGDEVDSCPLKQSNEPDTHLAFLP